MKKHLISTLILTFSSSVFAASVDDLRWIGQDYKPYSYVNEAGERAGSSVALVNKIMGKIGSTKQVKDIEIHAFSRMFVHQNNDPNTVFFPLARTPDREDYFKWVGPIAMDEPVFFAKKSKNIIIKSDGDLNQYKIAGRDGYGPVKSLNNVDLGDSDQEDLQKLQADQVDLVICNKASCLATMQDQGMKIDDYKIVYSMQTSDLSLAFNKETDDKLIEQVKKALEEIKIGK